MNQGRIIVITGAPGTGKTTTASAVAKESDLEKSVHMHTDDFYHYHVRKPSAREYDDCCNEFWNVTPYVIGYFFLVMLGIAALLLPVVIYLIFVISYDINSPWIMLGWVGGFVIGIGLFNYVAIIIKQYLGHLVSILSFIIGSILIWISLVQMGIV